MPPKPVKKAILPVAGMGTRFLPATKAQPKEMLPIYDTPAIQFIVQEAVEAGIEEIIIVTGRNKRAIEDHFDRNFELEFSLEAKGKHKELALIRGITDMAHVSYVRQPEPKGDGHAILCAERILPPDEPIVVLFGDDLVFNENGPNAVQQLIQAYEETGDPVVLLEEIEPQNTSKYGIVDFEAENGVRGRIKDFVEKPSPADAPSNLGVVGKYLITPEIVKFLQSSSAGTDGEIRLANAFMDYLHAGKSLQGRILTGTRYDTGDKIGFLKATLHVARQRGGQEAEDAIREFIG